MSKHFSNEDIHKSAERLGIVIACTVGELYDLLGKAIDNDSEYRNKQIISAGVDIGGYDVSFSRYVCLRESVSGNLLLSHYEKSAYKKDKKNLLSFTDPSITEEEWEEYCG